MKKRILLLFFTVLATLTNAQYQVTAGKHQYKFFKSYEDYKADKPVEGIKVNSCRGTKVEYTENGVTQKCKASKLPYAWFCNEEGMLMRVSEGDLYYVIVDGSISVYINAGDGTVSKPDNADYILTGKVSDSFPELHYSLSANGKIEKLKDSVLEEYLEKHKLTSQYENDPKYKRERKDCVMCWQNKKANKKIKYIKLINEKTQ